MEKKYFRHFENRNFRKIIKIPLVKFKILLREFWRLFENFDFKIFKIFFLHEKNIFVVRFFCNPEIFYLSYPSHQLEEYWLTSASSAHFQSSKSRKTTTISSFNDIDIHLFVTLDWISQLERNLFRCILSNWSRLWISMRRFEIASSCRALSRTVSAFDFSCRATSSAVIPSLWRWIMNWNQAPMNHTLFFVLISALFSSTTRKQNNEMFILKLYFLERTVVVSWQPSHW